MKYKVGDKVKVKKSLEQGSGYGQYVNEKMAALHGKMVTIKTVEDSNYGIEGDSWDWTDDMFEGLVSKTKPRGRKNMHVVVWDEKSGDPAQVFEYKKEMEVFVADLITRDNVIKASIRVYRVMGKPMEVVNDFKLSEVN